MSTAAPTRIVPRNAAEQEMYDQLLMHPDGVLVAELNPRDGKRRGEALRAWMADGLITPPYASSLTRVRLDVSAIDAERQLDLRAEAIMDAWQVARTATQMLAEDHRREEEALQRALQMMNDPAPYDDMAQEEMWSVRPWAWHPSEGRREIGHAMTELDRARCDIESTGGDWMAVTARAEELYLEQQEAEMRAEAEEAARLAAIDPNADPLGGDA